MRGGEGHEREGVRDRGGHGRERDAHRGQEQSAARDHPGARRRGLGNLIEAHPDGLDLRTGARGTALSGGEAQRAALARALLRNAPVLLLDLAGGAATVPGPKTGASPAKPQEVDRGPAVSGW
ncbi:ATP-binding cassette domain-containing protein [Streptomyces sp. NPDC014646]|uniref:ATP-binding cassette domain-containing protein n=1 Tax=Streptomyces sp. NPDC014646 TaxID=3364877 RepID=UPI0036F6F7E9